MREAGVPTADFAAFDDADSARRYVKARNGPIVVKADGLALGKGVVICHDANAALERSPTRWSAGASAPRAIASSSRSS